MVNILVKSKQRKKENKNTKPQKEARGDEVKTNDPVKEINIDKISKLKATEPEQVIIEQEKIELTEKAKNKMQSDVSSIFDRLF